MSSKTTSSSIVELAAYFDGYRAGANAKTRAPVNGDRDLHQFLKFADTYLSAGPIAYCECPSQDLTNAQQLLVYAAIERTKELRDQGLAHISAADPENCPDCTYAVRDRGKFIELASGVFTLGHASNCMATGDTAGMPRTLNHKCAHCGESNTTVDVIVDMTPRDNADAIYLGKLVYCNECRGGGKTNIGITLVVESTDVCCATQVYAESITEQEASDLIQKADPRDVFYPDRKRRERAAIAKGGAK